jgi:hypothetical protein
MDSVFLRPEKKAETLSLGHIYAKFHQIWLICIGYDNL